MARREPDDIPRIADSPVQETLSLLGDILSLSPQPEAPTEGARRCGELLGNHLIALVRGCGELNVLGQHSAAVCLFRPMEDALDLFAAITVISGAAERWLEGRLRPSDAAKLWTPRVVCSGLALGDTFGDYRRALRSLFNPLSHCDYSVVKWDLYVDRSCSGAPPGLQVDSGGRYVLELNAFRIDAQLVAHCHEFLHVFTQGYATRLSGAEKTTRKLDALAERIEAVLGQYSRDGHLEAMEAPEAEGIPLLAPHRDPTISVDGEWHGKWECHGEEFLGARLTICQDGLFLKGTLAVHIQDRGKFHQDLHGIAQGDELFLDAVAVSDSPEVYEPDRLELKLGPEDSLVGLHKCDLGQGPAEFRRVLGGGDPPP